MDLWGKLLEVINNTNANDYVNYPLLNSLYCMSKFKHLDISRSIIINMNLLLLWIKEFYNNEVVFQICHNIRK